MLKIFYSIWICGVPGIGLNHSTIICNESELNTVLSILKKDNSIKIEKITKYKEK
jgi:hypothetical protein